MKKIFLLGLVSLFSFAQATEVSTSVAVTTDYVWRGQTQGTHDAAVQGALEASMHNFTLGAWASSLGGGNWWNRS